MTVTPSQPDDVPPGYSKHGTKKRRRSQLHHQIAWWISNRTTNEVGLGPDGENTTSTLLSEGENWLVCSSSTSPTQPFNVCIVNNDLHKFSGATTGQPCPFEDALDNRTSKLADDAEESLAGVPARTSNHEGIALLCIDVDEKGRCVAVKDMRQIDPSVQQHKSAPNEDMMTDDDIVQAASNIEFFHARRKIYIEPPLDKKASKSNDVIVENGNDKKRLDDTNCSSGESTSGYGSDDEEDCNDAAEELNEHNQVRFYDGPSLPSRESDQDDKGRAMYHHAESLPRRQLRVLQNGERILLRYKTTKGEGSEREKVFIMKFEYMYGHQHHSSKKRRECNDVKTHSSVPQATTGQRKPRLLSVKSADVKSTEKKRFTLNSTSAADAPTAEEQDDGTTRKMASNNNADLGHKAGKDWSALETENDDDPNIEAGKDEEGKNVAQNGGDDGTMEEYSYLTGEVLIKDQDYISAITGDEATNTARQPEGSGPAINGDKSDSSGEGDAATASAVILGAVTSPPKQPQHGGSAQKEISSPKRVTLGTSTKEESEKKQGSPMANGEAGKNDVLFEEDDDDEKAENENSQQSAVFFTAPDHDESDEENMSGEELLSPVKHPKNKDGTVHHAVHFDSEALAAVAAKDDDDGDDSVTDYSLTQPFPVPRDVTEQKRSTSSSCADEEKEEDDDDSTVCPEADDIACEKVQDSKPSPIISKNDHDEGSDVYDEPTQPIQFAPKSHEVCNQSDDDDDYHAETQFDIFTSKKNAPIQHDDNLSTVHDADDATADQNNPGSVMKVDVESPKTSENNSTEEREPIEDAKRNCEAAAVPEESGVGATKPQPQTKSPEQKNADNEIGNEAAIEKERLDNSAVHQIQGGAMMTGPVGGAVALASSSSRHLDVPNSLVKTAAMLQSIDPKTNPLPDSTEETVCQIDDAKGKDEADESVHAPATKRSRKKRATRSPDNQGVSGDIGVRDPNIPTNVFIDTNHDRETTSRRSTSRKRSTPTSGRRKESNETIRVMFTGLAPTKKHKQVNHVLLFVHIFLPFVPLTTPSFFIFLNR